MNSFKVKFVFPNHPDWNTEEPWEVSKDKPRIYEKSIEVIATAINSTFIVLLATQLNPDVKLNYFKQKAVVEDGKLIVTIE